MTKPKRLAWRCKNQQQQRDKALIYNSREWKTLKMQKLDSTQWLCERCLAEGRSVPARCVHHIVPIETATSFVEMRKLAFCGLSGLMSLCFRCHAEVHAAVHSHAKATVKERERTRNERWKASLIERYTTAEAPPAETETPAALV